MDVTTAAVVCLLWPSGLEAFDRGRLGAFAVLMFALIISRHQIGLWNHTVAGIGTWWARVAFGNLLMVAWASLGSIVIAPDATAAMLSMTAATAAAATLVRVAFGRHVRRSRSIECWIAITPDGSCPDPWPAASQPETTTTIESFLAEPARPHAIYYLGADAQDHDVDRVRAHAHLAGATLVLAPSPGRLASNLGHQSKVRDIPLVVLTAPNPTTGSRRVQRVFDLLAAIAAVLLLAPLMAAVWVLIRLSSSGRPIYRQHRVGLGGKHFTMLKFRTMVDGAERTSGPVLASRDDPRMTREGRLLRRTRLDELPQLFNVLRGEMSIIGPRPERPVFVAQHVAANPEYALRHLVRPGITGMAQVAGAYGTDANDKLAFDLRYIHGRTLLVDLRILMQTILFLPVRLGWSEQVEDSPASNEVHDLRDVKRPA